MILQNFLIILFYLALLLHADNHSSGCRDTHPMILIKIKEFPMDNASSEKSCLAYKASIVTTLQLNKAQKEHYVVFQHVKLFRRSRTGKKVAGHYIDTR